MNESTDAPKRFTAIEADGVYRFDVFGDEESLKWTLVEKVNTAPVSISTNDGKLLLTTRDRAVAAEITALLPALGYRPG